MYDRLHLAALDQVNAHAEQLALLRRIAQARPSPANLVELAVNLMAYDRDVEGARDALAKLRGCRRPAVRLLVEALVLVEEGSGERAAPMVERARLGFVVATKGFAPGWMALFDVASARALAQSNRRDLAERYFRRAEPLLLASGCHALLDAAAADLDAARKSSVRREPTRLHGHERLSAVSDMAGNSWGSARSS